MSSRYIKVLLCLIGILSANAICAQDNYQNAVDISSCFFNIPGVRHFYDPDDQLGIYFKRRISKTWSIDAGFSKWNNYNIGENVIAMEPVNHDTSMRTGIHYARMNFGMVDLMISITPLSSKRAYFRLGVGPSYYWGTNVYLTDLSQSGPGAEGWFLLTYKTEDYIGIVSAASLDFVILKRFTVGTDFRYRYYPKLSSQEDLGVHVGFLF